MNTSLETLYLDDNIIMQFPSLRTTNNASDLLYLNLKNNRITNITIHRRSKVSVQNSQAGQHDESRHNFKVVYIHQLGHYASLLSVLLLNWF